MSAESAAKTATVNHAHGNSTTCIVQQPKRTARSEGNSDDKILRSERARSERTARSEARGDGEDDKESFDIACSESGTALGTRYASAAQRRLENTEKILIIKIFFLEALIS